MADTTTSNLIAHVLDDADQVSTTAPISLPAGNHTVEIEWQAASQAFVNDGVFRLMVDNTVIDEFTSIANDEDTIEDVQFGAIPYTLTAAMGSYYLDAFESWREVPDQPIPTLSEWGMLIMSLFIAGAALIILRKKSSEI